jgi:hypothetical protein
MRHSFLTLVGSQFGSYWIHRTATTTLFHNVLKVILRTQNPIELASHTPTPFWETKIFNTLPAKRTICNPSSDEEDMRRRFWSDTCRNSTLIQCATCTRPDFYVNTFFDALSTKRHPTKKVSSHEEDLEAGFFGRIRSFQHSSFIRRFRKRASQAHERASDIFGMLKNILPLSIIGFKNSQRQKTVINSVVRRISACPRYLSTRVPAKH